MKSARVLLFVYCAFLVLLIGCGGNSNSTSQTTNPGSTGTPPSTGGSGGGSGGGSSGGGGGTGGGSSPTGFLYTVENPNAAASVEAFSIGSNGALTHISSSNAGVDAGDIVTNSKFVFVANSPSGLFPRPPIQLFSYAVGSSGALTPADQETFSNSDDTMPGIMLDPTGTHLYVDSDAVDTTGRVSTFAIDNNSGKMTSQPPDVTSLPNIGRMAISPSGLLAYVATFTPHHTAIQPGIELLLRDPATGSLTDSGHRFHGTHSSDEYSDLAFSAGGQYLLALFFTFKIAVFAVNPATGDLTVASELNGNFQGMAVDRTGRFVVVTDNTGTVASYRINADGTLSIQGTATATPGVRHVTIDASNKFVYVQNNSAPQIFGFTFDASSGALVAIPGSPFATAAQPIRMTAVGR